MAYPSFGWHQANYQLHHNQGWCFQRSRRQQCLFWTVFMASKLIFWMTHTGHTYCFEIVKEAWKYSTCLLLLSPSVYLVFGVSSMFKKIPKNTKPVVSQYPSFGWQAMGGLAIHQKTSTRSLFLQIEKPSLHCVMEKLHPRRFWLFTSCFQHKFPFQEIQLV